MAQKWIQWQTHAGEPIQVNEMTITPQSQALVVQWPRGGMVWNRPTAVTVTRDGVDETIPIVDVTRQALLALAAVALLWRLLAKRR